MPLSEQEQRLLDEMERNLYKNDADFVASVGRSFSGAPNYRLIVIGSLLAVLGVGVIVAGVIFQMPLVGIAGFVILLAGALVALAGPTPGSRPAARNAGEKPAQRNSSASFMDRLSNRWDERGRRDER